MKSKEEVRKIPVVSILGHVDHGKTTLLDYIREASVQLKEVGGITQKISAFTINPKKDVDALITFVDTPGHEAFDLMRFRGGSVADIVLLIVAADDGVKPQTVESIEIIKNAPAKPIVVINKVDLGEQNVAKIKRDLANKGLLVEGMGGDIPVVEVSAKTGQGVDELLEMINLVVDVTDLKKEKKLPEGVLAKGFILESIKDKTRGSVATLVVKEGNFSVGDWFTYRIKDEIFVEKIKAFLTEEGTTLKDLKQGFGGRIIGLSNLVDLGTEVFCLSKKDEKLAKSLFEFEEKQEEVKADEGEVDEAALLAGFFGDENKDVERKNFKVLIKSSSEGSLEAIKKSVAKIPEEEIEVEIVKSAVGDINIGDIELASVTKAVVLGFEVSYEKGALDLASKLKVFTKTYDIIYKLIDEIADAVQALASPEDLEEEIGSAEIRGIFELSDGTQVIGCKGRDGFVRKGNKAYIVRNDEIIAEGKIISMKHNKNDIKEGSKGGEFGVVLNNPAKNIEVGDLLYCFKVLK
jgi:translation initiation factor IF-2